MAVIAQHEVTTRRWRREEYDRLVDLGMFTGERLELLDGLLVVREPQGSSHAATGAHVARILTAAFGAGWHARIQAPLALDEHSEPEPDIAIVPGVPFDYRDAHPMTAALVVEMADASLRLDRRFKSVLYARGGLPEYWIVNLVDRALEVYRDPRATPDGPLEAAYQGIDVMRPPAMVAPLAAPRARIAVADLLPPAAA